MPRVHVAFLPTPPEVVWDPQDHVTEHLNICWCFSVWWHFIVNTMLWSDSEKGLTMEGADHESLTPLCLSLSVTMEYSSVSMQGMNLTAPHIRIASQIPFPNVRVMLVGTGDSLCYHWPASTVIFTLGIECRYFLWKTHKRDRWNPTLPPLFGCLTHSPALHQDSKNMHALAYLCFLLFHVIVVPVVSCLSWFMHCLSIDYAITEVATSDLRTFQLIAKIHQTSEKKENIWKRNN